MKRKIKVMFSHDIFLNQKYGGISRYYYEVIKFLQNHEKFDVRLVCFPYVNSYLKKDKFIKIIGFYSNNSDRNKFTKIILSLFNIVISSIYSFIYRPDIFHETFYSKYYVILPKETIRTTTVYDMIHEKFNFYLPPYELGWKTKEMAINRANFIFSISKTTKKDLINIMKVDKNKVKVTYLAADTKIFRALKPSENLTHQPYLLYVGWRKWYKNISILFDAFLKDDRLYDDFNLILFGGGKLDDEEVEIIKKYKRKDWQSKIIQVDGDDNLLAIYYNNAFAFIHTSLYEGFGIPPLEAMACGCPSILSPEGSISEIINRESAIFFDPKDTEALTKSIIELKTNKERRRKLINNGAQIVENYSWEQTGKQTSKVYLSLVD